MARKRKKRKRKTRKKFKSKGVIHKCAVMLGRRGGRATQRRRKGIFG